MQFSGRVLRRAVLAAALVGACAASPAFAAPVGFSAAVEGDGPFAHYRFDEAGPITAGTSLHDASLNARHGTYNGSTAASVAGAGVGSDPAVSFTGGATGPYATSSISEFGASIGQSTYEFLFRTNTINPTGGMTLFGAFNRADGTDPTGAVAASVDLNLSATGSTSNGLARLFIRGADGRSVAGTIPSLTLADGLFHHLAFTYDDRANGGVGSLINAYVDGLPQLVTESNINGVGVPDAYGNFEFAPSFAARQNRDSTGAIYDLRANVTLDEAALYTVALTPAQIFEHATAALSAGDTAVSPEPALAVTFISGFAIAARRRRRNG